MSMDARFGLWSIYDYNRIMFEHTLIPEGIYQHYKGMRYVLVDVGTHTETGEKFVVYRALYDTDDLGPTPLFVRPYELFVEEVVVAGGAMSRFVFIEMQPPKKKTRKKSAKKDTPETTVSESTSESPEAVLGS